MKKTSTLFKIFILIFILSLIIIGISIYKITHSSNEIKKSIEIWEHKEITKKSSKLINFKDSSDTNNLVTDKKLLPVQYKTEPTKSEVIGKLTITSTKEILPIIYGTSDSDLEKGVGLYTSTSLPGENGNCLLFGHRDGAFKGLKNIKLDDKIFIETSVGKLVYKVIDTKITLPNDPEILKSYDEPMLTLVTCYPFNYIGSAPKRFIVTAELIVN
ncbi:class D sortase [Clostridium ganghwense]|uniref:Class D sortase n=1 Tax=Clostridium ganghwense TaxID=312089 RepID=A0ABT4CKJ8_9CLOT|nr:class D sortase [Clostridium ganghwense]MCY6369575.1 class D sortase [Clostridium ganghwense]